jgi:hypothetical protein
VGTSQPPGRTLFCVFVRKIQFLAEPLLYLESWLCIFAELFGYLTYLPSLREIHAFGDIIATQSRAGYGTRMLVCLNFSF